MKIGDFLSEDLVIPELHASVREGVLEELVGRISDVRPDVDRALAYRVLLERERLGSTGVGNGFAIPHARLPKISTVIGCFARSRDGVSFGSLDGKPVHLFLTLLAPEGSGGLHLKALARASRLFKDPDFRTRLITANGIEIWSMISAQDKRLVQNE
jgi:PTS system nitrogen regulatory IIA component